MKLLSALLFMSTASMAMQNDDQNVIGDNPFKSLPREIVLQIFGQNLHKIKSISRAFENIVKGTPNKKAVIKNFNDQGLIKYDGLNVMDLEIRRCWFGLMTDKELETILSKFPNLRVFDFGGLNLINDKKLKIVSENSPNLVSIRFGDGQLITDLGILSLSKLTKLKSISNSHALKITDSSIKIISKKWPNLESLEIKRSPITNEGLRFIGKLTHLTSLNISECSNITGEGLSLLTELPLVSLKLRSDRLFETSPDLNMISRLSRLTFLDLSYCRNITNQGLETLINKLHNLASLCFIGEDPYRMYSIPGIRDRIKCLKQKFPQLNIIDKE